MILTNSLRLRYWQMVTAWTMKSSREGLHKLLSSGVSSTVVAAMDEQETTAATRKCDTSQVLNAEHWADLKITRNIELVGAGTKPSQNLVWIPASSMKLF